MLLCSQSRLWRSELRIFSLHLVDLVAADEADALEPVGRKRVQPSPTAAGPPLRRSTWARRPWSASAAAAAGANHDDSHAGSSRSTRIISVLIIASPYATIATVDCQLTVLVPRTYDAKT